MAVSVPVEQRWPTAELKSPPQEAMGQKRQVPAQEAKFVQRGAADVIQLVQLQQRGQGRLGMHNNHLRIGHSFFTASAAFDRPESSSDGNPYSGNNIPASWR